MEEVGDGRFSVVLHYADGTEERLPAVTPAEALMLPSLLHKKDPVSFFVLGEFLHRSLQMEDDGSAPFLLKAGQQILRILEESIRTQTYLRNIFEMTFDGMERSSQQERFETTPKWPSSAIRHRWIASQRAGASFLHTVFSAFPFWNWLFTSITTHSALPGVNTAGRSSLPTRGCPLTPGSDRRCGRLCRILCVFSLVNFLRILYTVKERGDFNE